MRDTIFWSNLPQWNARRKSVDAQGRIYVADLHRVVRMNDITGNGWTALGSDGGGNGQFNYIRGLAVDKKGRIYVSDFFNNRIVRIGDMKGGAGLRTALDSRSLKESRSTRTTGFTSCFPFRIRFCVSTTSAVPVPRHSLSRAAQDTLAPRSSCR